MKRLLFTIIWCTCLTGSILAQLNNNGARIIIQSGARVTATMDLRNTSSGTLSNAGTLQTTQSFANNTGATFSGDGATLVGNNWTNSATFTPGTSPVTFNDVPNGLITSGGSAFNGVVITKPANNYMYLGDAATINGNLNFQSANNYLALGTNNLTINTVTGAGTDRFIATNGAGLVTKSLTGTNFVFPIGYGTGFNGGAATISRYSPVTVNSAANLVAQQFQAAYYKINPSVATFPTGAPFSTASLSADLCKVSNVEYFDVNGSASVQLTFTWDASSNLVPLVTNIGLLRVAGWNGTQWVNLGQASVTGNLTAGSITTPALVPNLYTAFTFATANPLAFTVTGGGLVCTTDNIGVPVGLNGSELNVNYQLFLNGNPVGAPVAGTGAAISFGNQLGVGTYTVVATSVFSGCTRQMTGSVAVATFNCTIVISDPCVCLNNATTLTNGQFGEQIKVNAPSTQVWTVSAVTGLYTNFSPAPPASPTPITVGTVLVNIGGNMFT